MSDNESFESQTETEGSTDNEDIAEQSSVVQPFSGRNTQLLLSENDIYFKD
jgi:hypothetical protein